MLIRTSTLTADGWGAVGVVGTTNGVEDRLAAADGDGLVAIVAGGVDPCEDPQPEASIIIPAKPSRKPRSDLFTDCLARTYPGG